MACCLRNFLYIRSVNKTTLYFQHFLNLKTIGIFKKANNIYVTVRDTYTSISGSSYEEAEEVIIESTNGDLELISQKKGDNAGT